MSAPQLRDLISPETQARLVRAGALTEDASPDDLRQLLARLDTEFRENAPLSASAAATTILDGVRTGAWRILVGEDASTLDAAVRAQPNDAYDYPALARDAARAKSADRSAEDAPRSRSSTGRSTPSSTSPWAAQR